MFTDIAKKKIYNCWYNMKERCLNEEHKWYSYYGGRGITICEEWMDFHNFYNWAINNGYSASLSIDRINNEKGYCPENCKWSTKSEQSKNRRYLRKPKYEYYGVRKYYNGKFRADVARNGKDYCVGYFFTADEANAAREEFIRRNNL